MIKIAPSVLAADPMRLGEEASRMARAGADWIHVDVMDGHFVPNLSFSPSVVKGLRGILPEMPLDVHLMLTHPEQYAAAFAEAGATGITIHAEIPGDPCAVLRQIHALGCRAGLALKPGTPARAVTPLLAEADLVLVMTVEPGFGGQPFMTGMLDKLTELRALGYTGLIEADGGIREDNLPPLIARGLDVAVMGTGLFRAADARAEIAALHAMGRANTPEGEPVC